MLYSQIEKIEKNLSKYYNLINLLLLIRAVDAKLVLLNSFLYEILYILNRLEASTAIERFINNTI